MPAVSVLKFYVTMLISKKRTSWKWKFRGHRFSGLVHVFGHERHFSWPVQGTRHMWRSEASVHVARARNHIKHRGRRIMRRIEFYMAGELNPQRVCLCLEVGGFDS